MIDLSDIEEILNKKIKSEVDIRLKDGLYNSKLVDEQVIKVINEELNASSFVLDPTEGGFRIHLYNCQINCYRDLWIDDIYDIDELEGMKIAFSKLIEKIDYAIKYRK